MNENQRVGMFRALQLFFKNYANFTGRSKRSEYWWMFLWNLIVGVVAIVAVIGVLATVGFAFNPSHIPGSVFGALLGVIVVVFIVGLAVLVPSIALAARRYRDAGISPWWLLVTMLLANILSASDQFINGTMSNTLVMIGGVLGIVHLVICALKSKPEEA